MSRSSAVRVVLLSVLTLTGCRDFTVPRQPEVQDVTLEPSEAFGEQEIALRFQGKADLAQVQVSIGGRLATLPEGQSGDGVVRAVVPRLSGLCQEQVPVLVSAPGFSFNAATLRYKGVGHPGSPRPTLSSQTKSVAFLPTGATVMYGENGAAALVASGNGEAVLVYPLGDGARQRIGAVYRKDFVLGLDTPGAGIIVDVTQHGEVEQFSLGTYVPADVFAPTGEQGKEAPPLLPDLACYLPSALSEPPSLAILPLSSGGDATSDGDAGITTRPEEDGGASKIEEGDAGLAGPEPDAGPVIVNYQGMLLAAAPSPKAFQVVADQGGLSTPGNDPVTAWLAGSGSSAAAIDDKTMAVFKGGAVPAVWVLDGAGKGLQSAIPLASQGDEWSVAATTSAASGYALAYLQGSLGLDGRLLLVGRPGQTDPTSCDCSSPSPTRCRADKDGYCLDTAGTCGCVTDDDCDKRATDEPCVSLSGALGTCQDFGGLKICMAQTPTDGCYDSGTDACRLGSCDLGGGLVGECSTDAVGGCSCVPKQSDIPCAFKPECGGPCSDAEGSGGTCGPDMANPALCVCVPGSSVSDPDGGRLPPPPSDDAGTGGKGGGGEDAGVPSVVELPMHGPALTSLAADPAKNVVYGVDGVSTWLYTFSIAPSPLSVEQGQSVPLPEPAVRVLAVLSASGAQPVVIGRSGRIFVGPEYNAQKIRLGLSSVSPRIRSSCEAPQAVVAASEIGATVVVPTAEGPAAFLEGAPGARFADTVAFERDGGLPLAYFYSGGVVPPPADPLADAGTGFVVSQTSAQTYGQSPDGGLPKKSEFHFSARAATAILTGEQTATLVVGSPEGLRFVPMEAGRLPEESQATLEPGCPDVRRLVPLGEGSAKVFVLGHREQRADGTFDQLLCLADASAKSAEVATVQLPISAVAAASTLEPADGAAKRVHRLYTVGWEVPAGGTAPVLTVRHVDAAAAAPLQSLQPLDWGTQAKELLPTGGAPISALAVSPDGRRLLVALAGDKPGVLAIDPAPFLSGASEAEKAAALTTLWLPATPVGIGFTEDGARAVIALSDDTLAFVE